jgi:hypothetical protein
MLPPFFKLIQVPRRIEMVVKIDFHPVSPFLLRVDLFIFHPRQKINPSETAIPQFRYFYPPLAKEDKGGF